MKRVLYILGVLLVSLLLVSGMLVAALLSDKVETAAVQLVTKEFARALGTKAHVGHVSYTFPARLRIEDIYIEDRQGDTLAYIGEAYAHFRPLALRDSAIRFSHVALRNGVANIYRLPDSTYNYQFLVDAFAVKEEQQPQDPMQSLLSVEDIRLDSFRVRYDDYRVALPHACMDLHLLSRDSIDAEIEDLTMTAWHDGQRLDLQSLKAHVIVTDTLLTVPTLTAQLPHSYADMSGIEIRYPEGDTLYLSRSANDILFKLQLHETRVLPADLAFFEPRLARLQREISVTGEIGGTLDSLYSRELSVAYNHQSIFAGDVEVTGLPNMDSLYLRANFRDVHTNARMLQDFLSQWNARPIHLPVQLHRLGDIHYRGLAEGRLHDLTLHGAFRTAAGGITTDGRFRTDSTFTTIDYDARIVARRLRLGYLLAYKPIGTTTIDIRSKGRIADQGVSGEVQGHVREFTYNGYTYQDLDLNGTLAHKQYAGQFTIDDPHLKLSFKGVVDMRESNPEINCDLVCRHFDSKPLGIKALGDHLQTRFKLAVDLNGINPDRMSGYMVLDSLFLATSRDSVLMRQMTLLVSSMSDNSKAVTLRSDYLTAQADGLFRYADLAPAFQAMLAHYLPSAVEAPKKNWQPVNIDLQVDGKRLRDLQRLFTAPITLSDHPTLRAHVDLRPKCEPKIEMNFKAPGIRAGKTPVHDLTVALNTVDTLRHAGSKGGSGLAFSISAEAMQMQTVLSCLAFRDTILTHVTLRQEAELDERLPEGWRSLTPRQLMMALGHMDGHERYATLMYAQRVGTYGGDINIVTHFDKYNKKPLIDLHIKPSTLVLRDTVYTISDSRITYIAADTLLDISHFAFEGGGQHILANGVASSRATDTLSVDLKKVDASYVVPFVLPRQTIMFNGLLSGKAQLAAVMKRPSVAAQIHIDSMGLNNCWFGDAEVDLHIKDSLYFHAEVDRPERHVVSLDGKAQLFDGTGRWELNMEADSVPLAFINHWTEDVLKNLDGNATGHVCVGGDAHFTYVLLRAAAQNASFTLPWTGCRYTIANDTIVMDTLAIRFPNVHLTDVEGHPVTVNGEITHYQFTNFHLDLHVDADNALVFDQPFQQREMLQGHVYAVGHVDVTGHEQDIHVNATAQTAGKSSFRLSLDNVSSAYESNFVHFIARKDTTAGKQEQKEETDLDNIDVEVHTKADSADKYSRMARCLLTLELEVNPQLLFQLVIGERNGDMIQARGNGALRLTYDTETGDVRLLGTYNIDQGTLRYTVANMIRREFTVGEGATIVFSGDPENPQLDVTAKYRVTANLRDLFGDEIDQVGTSRTNIPVLTCLHMTGNLNNPILSFSLELPLSDQTVQQEVRQVINTDEMLMRQVIYLLVFGRFFTPDYMSQAQYATLNSTYSLLSSTVTGQINSWLSKLTDVLTLGVAIRTDGYGADASQEYEAQFQLQPVDRLVINGNVGYRYNDVSNQPFFGDLDVELLLTEDGQWRVKGYTHTVDKYSLRQATTMQGVSVLWKKDFNIPTKEERAAKKAAREARKREKEKEKAAK